MTLRGGPGVVFDSGVEPSALGTTSPSDPNFGVAKTWKPYYYAPMDRTGLINVRNSSDVRLESLAVRNSWPNGIAINDSQGVTIDATSTPSAAPTQSGPAAAPPKASPSRIPDGIRIPLEAVWKSLDWQQVHDGAYNFLNGALFQARDIGGDVLIRNNDVRNAFNGVRVTSNSPELGQHVRILSNRFTNISDNVVEPETWASHWRFQGNTMEGVHAPVSLDDVGGNDFLVTGNTFVAQQRPRAELRAGRRLRRAPRWREVLQASCGDGHNGTRPPLSGLRVINNTFVIGPFPTRFADADFPPGTVRCGNHISGYARNLREK